MTTLTSIIIYLVPLYTLFLRILLNTFSFSNIHFRSFLEIGCPNIINKLQLSTLFLCCFPKQESLNICSHFLFSLMKKFSAFLICWIPLVLNWIQNLDPCFIFVCIFTMNSSLDKKILQHSLLVNCRLDFIL
jgi:hypothetical protein